LLKERLTASRGTKDIPARRKSAQPAESVTLVR